MNEAATSSNQSRARINALVPSRIRLDTTDETTKQALAAHFDEEDELDRLFAELQERREAHRERFCATHAPLQPGDLADDALGRRFRIQTVGLHVQSRSGGVTFFYTGTQFHKDGSLGAP